MPIILKGIMHPEDALEAMKVGVDGIIVSNHGGRQVDGGMAALDALPAVVDVINDQIPILFDSGIRRGADILKALALGARAAMHHGGPYPATTDPRATSIGTAAIQRFVRPVCYQDAPSELLPDELKPGNPTGLRRLVDGELGDTTDADPQGAL